MKNATKIKNSRVDQKKERITEIAGRDFEIIQSEKKRGKKRLKRVKKVYMIYRTSSGKPLSKSLEF